MRHRKSGVKLNRTTSHRQAMFRNMVTSLFKYERIKTTDAKAKELRRWADHIVTLAKRGDLHARRLALSIVREKDVVHKLFEEAQERFGSRNGGYTRMIKIGRRSGDAAAMTLVELVRSDEAKPAKKKKTATKKVTPTVAEPATTKEAAEEQTDSDTPETEPLEAREDASSEADTAVSAEAADSVETDAAVDEDVDSPKEDEPTDPKPTASDQ